jgi:DNA-directed RNA polymerase specialized sigma24 family protein
MIEESSFYFLSSTAKKFWEKNDLEGQNKMFAFLVKVHKDSFFRRVTYVTGSVPDYLLTEMAENVFLSTWETFNKKGIANEIKITGIEYTGFFYIMFKRAYLKALEKMIRQSKQEYEYGLMQSSDTESIPEINTNEAYSVRVQKALNKISPDCKDLLLWKHVDGLSHDEIASRRKIDRDSSIKMLSRCGKRFREFYSEYKNLE